MKPASRFFSALFGRYPSDDSLRLEVRCLPPVWDVERPKPYPRQWYTLAPQYIENAAAACEHWGRDWDVYCGVLPRVGRSGSQNDVLWANWLYCDVDGGDEGVAGAVARVKAANIDRPDIAIQSGGGLHCVPLDTEILTKAGWKNWDEVNPGDVVMGYDRLSSTLQWTKMIGKVVKDSDEITHLHNRDFSVRCTPEHRWVGTVKSGRQGRIKTPNQMFSTKDIRRAGRHTILRSAPFKPTRGLPVTEREAAILGWIASDGSFGNGNQTRISQSDRKFTAEIRFLLMGVPHTEAYHHKDTPDLVTWNISMSWAREVLERASLHGSKHECDWSSFVLTLTEKCRVAFLDAFWKGDGCMNRGQRVIQQNPGKISDAIQLAIFLSGKTPRVSSSRKCEVIRYGRSIAQWDLAQDVCEPAPVWCPQTDLGTWVMRQGGTVTITGNCYWELDYPTALPDRDSRESFKRTLRRLCLAIGGASPAAHADTAACEVARILRVPGTLNHKIRDTPRTVRNLRHAAHVSDVPPFSGAVGFSSFARSYDWWRANLPAEAIAPGPRARPGTFSPIGTISPGLEAWARAGYPEGKRHQDFASAAAWLVRDVKVSKEQARTLLTIKAQNSPGRRAITSEEIDGVVKWA